MKIIKLEDIIPQSTASEESKDQNKKHEDEQDSDDGSDSSVQEFKRKQKVLNPRGRPKSGRIWKTQKSKFSSIVKTPGLRKSFEKKELLRQELKLVKNHSKAIKEEKKREKEEKRLRRQENLKRQEENRRKSEIVQVIKNTSKIKRMKKKQLRRIEKRDTTVVIK